MMIFKGIMIVITLVTIAAFITLAASSSYDDHNQKIKECIEKTQDIDWCLNNLNK